jgi:hypothetical protein
MAESSSDNDGMDQYCQMIQVRQARRKGVREEPAVERFSRETHQLEPGGSGLGSNAHPHDKLSRGELTEWLMSSFSEAMVKDCGVAMAKLQGHSWAPTPSRGSRVNVGTTPMVPSSISDELIGGKVRCRPMLSGWGGEPVVVGGRESRPHGEGVQRSRSIHADRGDRR